jgi:hypothetical protein
MMRSKKLSKDKEPAVPHTQKKKIINKKTFHTYDFKSIKDKQFL